MQVSKEYAYVLLGLFHGPHHDICFNFAVLRSPLAAGSLLQLHMTRHRCGCQDSWWHDLVQKQSAC